MVTFGQRPACNRANGDTTRNRINLLKKVDHVKLHGKHFRNGCHQMKHKIVRSNFRHIAISSRAHVSFLTDRLNEEPSTDPIRATAVKKVGNRDPIRQFHG